MNGGLNLGSAAKPSARSNLTTPTTMACDDMVKKYSAADRVQVLRKAPAPSNEQANRSEHLMDTLRLSNVLSTTTKRAPSQWTRIQEQKEGEQEKKER